MGTFWSLGEEEIQPGTQTFPGRPSPGTFPSLQWRCLLRYPAPSRFQGVWLRGELSPQDTMAGLVLWHLCLGACAPPFLEATLPPPHRHLAKKVLVFVVA